MLGKWISNMLHFAKQNLLSCCHLIPYVSECLLELSWWRYWFFYSEVFEYWFWRWLCIFAQ